MGAETLSAVNFTAVTEWFLCEENASDKKSSCRNFLKLPNHFQEFVGSVTDKRL